MPRPLTPPKTTLGEALRAARMERGWTQDYLADQIPGGEKAMISYWEVGTRRPSPEDLIALATALAADMQERRALISTWKMLAGYRDPVEDLPHDPAPPMTIQGAAFRGLGLIVDAIEDEAVREALLIDAKALVASYQAKSEVTHLYFRRRAAPPAEQIARALQGPADGPR